MHPDIWRILKIFIITVLISVVLSMIIIGVVIWQINSQIKIFESHAGRSIRDIVFEIERGARKEPKLQDARKNILFLGGDEVVGRESSQGVLTDTILIATIDVAEGDVALLSIPRDLWIPAYRTKINALHYYGEREAQTALERNPNLDESTIEEIRMSLLFEVLEQLTSLQMHHTIFLSLVDVSDLVELIDGVEIDVQRSFRDERYPRMGVDVSVETDPEVLFEAIEFEEGQQTMNAERVLQYLRSRNSEDELEGSDLGRTARQQRALSAVARKVLSPETLFNSAQLGKLFAFYADRYEDSFSIAEAISVLSYYADIESPPDVVVRSIEIPVDSGSAQGLLYTPPISKYGLWVYEARDPTFQAISIYIQQQLKGMRE